MKKVTPVRTFEDLECWQHCRTLRLFVAKEVVPALPKDERYRLGDQFLRAARSTTANIAGGYGRFHNLSDVADEGGSAVDFRSAADQWLPSFLVGEAFSVELPDAFSSDRTGVAFWSLV